VEAVAAALPPATRLAVFDAVTSNTALVLPLEALVELCHARWVGGCGCGVWGGGGW
jgi:selenocysteine lyase/cysteine desulfurase